jgi:alkylation response protein AidB-like acyl-CoA dehydrogenase
VTEFDALCANDSELAKLRSSIREFLAADRQEFGWQPAVDSWLANWDEGFSARLGDAGFVGLTIPAEYGGHGLGHLHRYVVTEELLAQGAPVAAHWIADRQVAPGLLSYGNAEQRQRLLPRIAAGRFYSAIGMSEHGAGSDLAAVQARATRTDGGWVLDGTKVWTSGAHLAHQIVVLARTSPLDPQHRHAGFSQFIVQTDSPGIVISPIALMNGEHHFNEVTFADVFVPDADVLGAVGDGWHQVTAELGFERSGPERILSTAPLIFGVIRALAGQAHVEDRRRGGRPAGADDLVAPAVGVGGPRARRRPGRGEPGRDGQGPRHPIRTGFRRAGRRSARLCRKRCRPDMDGRLRDLLATARLHAPLFTLRGGTNEVLRGVVAKGMGL